MTSNFGYFFLTNPKLWFNATIDDDKYICDNFSYIILQSYDISDYDLIDKILIYDQLTRHMKRQNLIDDTTVYDIKAQKLVEQNLIQQNFNEIEKYKPIERCFLLMPLRHTFNPSIIENTVLPLLLKWRRNNDCKDYQRFYQATLNSLANIKKGEDYSQPRKTTLDPEIFDKRSCQNFDNIQKIDHKIQINHQNVIVSLSGGVDSMVSLKLLHQLKQKKKDMNLVAIHINYGNRESANEEEEVCRHYCQKLGIRLYSRYISEIKRDCTFDRNLYEKITRKIRFNTYKYFEGYAVVLGHNKDDSLENIFSNIKNKTHYDNLLGMTEEGTENDVIILRPLLKISKSKIIEMAIKANIPFVYDSTPKWSERGKMRDILIPGIKNFDESILEGLLYMAKQYKDIYQLTENNIDNIQLKYCKNYIIFVFIPYKGFYFWKKLFKKITNYFKIENISNKSIENFSNNYDPNTNKKIHLSKKLYIIGNKCIKNTI